MELSRADQDNLAKALYYLPVAVFEVLLVTSIVAEPQKAWVYGVLATVLPVGWVLNLRQAPIALCTSLELSYTISRMVGMAMAGIVFFFMVTWGKPLPAHRTAELLGGCFGIILLLGPAIACLERGKKLKAREAEKSEPNH